MVRRYLWHKVERQDKKQQADLKGSVSGWHVYKDERGRAVYYDVFSKMDIF